ncbi:hypothetical protein PF003_g21464 [Phytophthora fragariae]|nr:hypothetical protein PF003_g21464 [Phytophthora fragariae]
MSARKVVDQSAAVQDSRFTTTIYLEGYQYTRATTSARKTSYRCSYYRSAGCKGKVDLIARTKTFTNFTDHTCERGDHLASETSDLTNSVTPDTVTTGHPYMVPTQGGFQPPPVNRVARAGPGQIDPNDLARIESPPLLFVRNSTLNFFQFNCMSGYGPDNTPNRVIGWAHPHLVELLKHAGSTIYVDTSCRHLPPGFGQCLALVVYNKPSGFFVPVYYVLCTLRTMARHHVADLAAETTTLPSAVEVFSEGEASSDEESIGDESDGDDDDDNVESFKCEPPLGRQSSVGNRDETATSLTKRST